MDGSAVSPYASPTGDRTNSRGDLRIVATHPLPPAVPRSGGRLTRVVGRLGLRLLGWRIEGRVPDLTKMVVIVAPHTSNWDFIVGLAAKFALGLDARWLGKHTIFRGPAGAVFRRLGGIPVNRASPGAVVDDCAREFARREALVLALAPEGTRRPVDEWRSGFWRIAKGADVPILAIALDWGPRVIRIGPLIQPVGTLEEQMPRIKAAFDGVRGLRR